MENETPYWENNNNKINNNIKTNYELISKFIGKICEISFNKGIIIPSISSVLIYNVKGIIQEYNNTYLLVKIALKKKNCISLFDNSNISAITMVEE